MLTRLRNLLLFLSTVVLLLHPARRRLWREMRAYLRRLPAALAAPLPAALAAQTPAAVDISEEHDALRRLADSAALLDRRSPLGLCLRRSLVRYHYLRRAGLPLEIRFGARFTGGHADRDVTGHAWVELDGEPYYEDGENYSGFTVMLRYPA
jgi:hypothetical protein